MRIDIKNTKALVIDYQERLVPVIHNKDELIKNSIKLLEGLSILDVPMILTTQYEKGLGGILPEIKNASHVPESFDKISFSCFGNEQIRKEIGNDKINIIVCGIEAHICVLQTVIDLRAAGYMPILVSDCISSRKESDKIIAMKRAADEGAMITSYESILFELLEVAGTDRFKKISNLIK